MRGNFYFVFYSERLNLTWILSLEEFLKECVTNKTGKMQGKEASGLTGIKQTEMEQKKKTVSHNLKNTSVMIFQGFIE